MNYINGANNFLNLIIDYMYLALNLLLIMITTILLLIQIKIRIEKFDRSPWAIPIVLMSIFNLYISYVNYKMIGLSDIFIIVIQFIVFSMILELIRLIEFIVDKHQAKIIYYTQKSGYYSYYYKGLSCEFINGNEIVVHHLDNYSLVCHAKLDDLKCKVIEKYDFVGKSGEVYKNEYMLKIKSKVKYKFV